ncbi:12893_t:CDS:1, partial [Gigaspora rosea]
MQKPVGLVCYYSTQKNKKKQLCINYQKLNSVTEKDVYPLSLIEEVLEAFQGAQWFSSLDLASNYWQVTIKEKDKKET